MTSSTGHRALYPGEATSFARAGISPAEAMDWTAMGLNAHQALEAVKSGRSLDDSTGSGDGDTPSVSGPRVSRDLALIRRNLLVTTSEIAVLAGKDLSAVTHWRKGQKKFPEPVVGGRSPLFNLEEVHAWLERNDKLANQPVAAWLWRKSVQALHQSTSGDDRSRLRGYVTAMVVVVHDFLDDVGGFVELRLTSGFERWLSETNPGLDDDLVEFLRQHLLGMDPEKETTRCAARAFRHALGCGFTRCGLLDEALDALAELSATRTTTSLPLSSLITDLACDLAGPPESVVDLACGEATLLTDLMNRSRSPDVRLRGVERDPDTAAIARIRLHLHHPGADWRIRVGDSLSGAGWGESFDVVVVDPPTRNAGKWVDLARSSLTADDTSRAFVLLPESALRANGPCTSEIKRGRLEAVVRLPSRLKRESRGLALCIFTSDLVTCEEILVIDLSDLKLKNLGYGTATPTISETGEGLPTAETCAAISRWRSTQTIDRALLQGRQRSISNYEAAVDGLTEAGLTEVRSSEMGLSPVLEFQLQAMLHEAASPSLLRQDIRFLRSTPDQAGKRCSFCGRTEDQVEQLITGIDAHICDVCVFRFNSSLHE